MKFPPHDAAQLVGSRGKPRFLVSPVPARRWHCGAINNVILHPLGATPNPSRATPLCRSGVSD